MAKKKKLEQPIEKIDNIFEISAGEVARDSYLEYGNYVAQARHMCSVLDGCKPSYRRLIYAATLFPKGKDIPATTLNSSVAATHPHGLTSMNELAATLVHGGVFSGEGAFGHKSIEGVTYSPGADRYVKTRLSDLYQDIMGDLIKDVPYAPSPVGAMEPQYLPMALPLCLILKSQVTGLGVGVASLYPCFSPQSLFAAYKENNPYLLEPNIDILMDKENSELERLWTTGKGRVIYAYKIVRHNLNGIDGILFSGDTNIFTPNLRKLKKLEDEGKIFLEDLTDTNGPKLFVGRVPGARGIDISMIEELSRKACYSAQTYNLNVTNGQTTFRIPLYDWIDTTYKNYLDLLVKVNTKKIEKTNFDIVVQEALPIIADYILNQNPKATDGDIVSTLDISIDVVKEVMSKPISYLRKNKDTAERVKALKTKLKELKKFDPILFTEGIIAKL